MLCISNKVFFYIIQSIIFLGFFIQVPLIVLVDFHNLLKFIKFHFYILCSLL